MFEIGSATNHKDLAEKFKTFATTNGSSYGLAYAGTGTGTMAGLGGTGSITGGASSVAETFTITATSATNFTVVGSVSGSLGAATVGTNFTNAKLNFRITAGGTAFIAGDVFTLSTAPKWTAMRAKRGCETVASSSPTGQLAGENVIDGKTVSASARRWSATSPYNIEFTCEEAETIAEYAIMVGSSSNTPRTWTFEYWNGSAWVTLDTRTNLTFVAGAFQSYTITSPVSATRYRWNVTAINGSSPILIDAIQLRSSVGGIDAAFSQYIYKAPGNNGTSEIYVGIHHFRRADADYFNLEIAALDGYQAGANLYAQPGCQANLYLPLQNSSTPYWFVINGRRAIIVVKIGSQYECAYLGFYDSYFTPAQLPYPIAIGGSLALNVVASQPNWDSVSWRWSNATDQHRAFTHSDPNTSSVSTTSERHQMRARRIDGTWRGFSSSHADNFQTIPDPTEGFILPYTGDFQLLDVNLDGSYILMPVVLCDAGPNILGELDGVFAISGQGNTAETLHKRGQINHLVIQNINRTDRSDWLAVALD